MGNTGGAGRWDGACRGGSGSRGSRPAPIRTAGGARTTGGASSRQGSSSVSLSAAACAASPPSSGHHRAPCSCTRQPAAAAASAGGDSGTAMAARSAAAPAATHAAAQGDPPFADSARPKRPKMPFQDVKLAPGESSRAFLAALGPSTSFFRTDGGAFWLRNQPSISEQNRSLPRRTSSRRAAGPGPTLINPARQTRPPPNAPNPG
jgi:hypothetical protein